MKYLLCTLLFIPMLLYGKDKQVFFFEGSVFYRGIAREEFTNVNNLFEGGAGFGFKYQDNGITALLNFTAGFSLDGGQENKHLGYKGDLNAEFSYLFKPIWEPFFLHLNEYDSLAKLYWRNYTGVGLKITAYDNNQALIKVGLAPVVHYERYIEDREHGRGASDRATMSYMISGNFSYAFYNRLRLMANWFIIPLYDFSECRVKSELGLIVLLFRDYGDRKTGGDFELKVGNDHYTRSPTYRKKTDIYCHTGVRFFM